MKVAFLSAAGGKLPAMGHGGAEGTGFPLCLTQGDAGQLPL